MRVAWTNRARGDLADIRAFSRQRWGVDAAKAYLADIRDTAESAAQDSSRLRPLRHPFHVIRVRSHYLIVHLDQHRQILTVARVLHTAMDLERHLPR